MLDTQEMSKHIDGRLKTLADDLHSAVVANDMPAIGRIEREYEEIFNAAPRHPLAAFLLGTLHSMTGRNGSAIALLEKAIEYGAQGPGAWINLGNTWKAEHADDKARACFEKGLACPPETKLPGDEAGCLNGLAGLHINAGDPETCIQYAEKSLEAEPGNRFALWNRALAYLELGRWREGFHWYDVAGFMDGGGKAPERKLKTYGGLPMWRGEPGKTVICYGEQGVGDEVMFLSIVPDLLRVCPDAILDVDKRIIPLVKRSFPGVRVFGTSGIEEKSPWLADVKADAVISMGSLGRYFRKKAADFPKTPYLTPDPDRVAYWRARLAKISGRPKIGVSWVGGTKKTRVDYRSMRPDALEPLFALDCDYVSLQYHDWAPDECARISWRIGKTLWHWHPVASGKDYDDTAALVAALDCVVTVNTSLLHLAGAVGAPTLCLTPWAPAWRYGVSGPNPWYASVKTVRQKRGEDWGPAVAQAVETVQRRYLRKEAA